MARCSLVYGGRDPNESRRHQGAAGATNHRPVTRGTHAGGVAASGRRRDRRGPIAVRKAGARDCATLTRVAHAAKRHWGYPAAWMRLWKDDLTITRETLSEQVVYCAVRGPTLLGFYALSGSGKTRELEHLWVRPAYMRSGVGRALLAHVLTHARATGATRLVIAADPNAEGFYRTMGARRAGRVPSQPPGRWLPRLVLRIAPARSR